MRNSPLETYDRRGMRRYQRYRRRSESRLRIIIAVTLGVTLVAGSAIATWRFLPRHQTGAVSTERSRAPKPPRDAAQSPVAQASARPAQTTSPAESRPATITIAAVGDMIFDRKVKELINAQGGEAPLSRVAERLRTADVTIGNLENALSDGGEENATKDVTLRGHPAGIEGLSLAGFDAVSIANNHMLDYGPQPLSDTIAALDAAGIGHAGAGADKDAAWKPATIDVDGTKVAYLAFTHVLPAGFLASETQPGVASGKMDLALIDEAIRSARKTHDYVIVSFHWGVEYEDFANGDQVAKAHRAIDAGADMVLAHHPHVIQGVEFYNGKLIAYSLGDFVFDHYSRKTGEAFILNAELGPDGSTTATATPVYLDDFGRPEVVTGSDATAILSRLRTISKPHGATVTIAGNLARITP